RRRRKTRLRRRRRRAAGAPSTAASSMRARRTTTGSRPRRNLSPHRLRPRVAPGASFAASKLCARRRRMACGLQLPPRMSRTRRRLIALVIALLVRTSTWLAPPYMGSSYMNRDHAYVGVYRGAVSEIDLAVLAGGYTLYDLRMVKGTGD